MRCETNKGTAKMTNEEKAFEIGRSCALEYVDQPELDRDDCLDNAFDTAIGKFADSNGYLPPEIHLAVFNGFESIEKGLFA
jgi:hypothetical protein